jgi:ketosteroid isomerase-like protein
MNLSRWRQGIAAVLLLAAICARGASPAPASAESQAIRQVLADQAGAWNRGDIDAFMRTYAEIDDLRFASGGTVTYGWKPTLERYRARYPDRATMGTLTFSDLTVTELGPDAALVFGRWQLQRAADAPGGLFTLLLRRTPAGWKIFADHTSAAGP